MTIAASINKTYSFLEEGVQYNEGDLGYVGTSSFTIRAVTDNAVYVATGLTWASWEPLLPSIFVWKGALPTTISSASKYDVYGGTGSSLIVIMETTPTNLNYTRVGRYSRNVSLITGFNVASTFTTNNTLAADTNKYGVVAAEPVGSYKKILTSKGFVTQTKSLSGYAKIEQSNSPKWNFGGSSTVSFNLGFTFMSSIKQNGFLTNPNDRLSMDTDKLWVLYLQINCAGSSSQFLRFSGACMVNTLIVPASFKGTVCLVLKPGSKGSDLITLKNLSGVNLSGSYSPSFVQLN